VGGAARARPDVLTATTVASMTARPSHAPAGAYYALGWQVVSEGTGASRVHAGAEAGGDGYVTRMPNGMVMAVLANPTRGQAAGGTLGPALNQAVRRITEWPAGTPF
jgi:hypothetical protein